LLVDAELLGRLRSVVGLLERVIDLHRPVARREHAVFEPRDALGTHERQAADGVDEPRQRRRDGGPVGAHFEACAALDGALLQGVDERANAVDLERVEAPLDAR
jgi:hypothetical protein